MAPPSAIKILLAGPILGSGSGWTASLVLGVVCPHWCIESRVCTSATAFQLACNWLAAPCKPLALGLRFASE